MKIEIYSLKDSCIGEFKPPFFMKNRAEALRTVSLTLQAPNNTLVDIASDLQLFYLGTIDQETGVIEPTIDFVANVMSLYKPVIDDKSVEVSDNA